MSDQGKATEMTSLVEREFVKKAIVEGYRGDGRAVDEFRSVHYEFGNDRGHVVVHLGQTKVMAVVSAQVSRPFPDRPLEGMFGIYVEVLEQGDDQDDVRKSALTRLLERLFKSGKTVDTESLCILPGEQVWSVRLDVHVLEDDGGVEDAISLASLAALLDFRRPDSTVIDGKAIIYSTFEKHPVPLTIQHHPISVTFGIFDLSEGLTSSHNDTIARLVADPNGTERAVSTGRITLSLNRQGELLSLTKLGGLALDPELIHSHCLPLAKLRTVKLDDQLISQLRK